MTGDEGQAADALCRLARQRGWALQGPVAPEGSAQRVCVSEGLLYRWSGPNAQRRAARVAWSCDRERAGQIPVVPALLERGPDWVLLENVAGVPLGPLQPGSDLRVALGPERGRALVQQLGRVLRKVHEVEIPQGRYGAPQEAGGGDGPWHTFTGQVAARLEAFGQALGHRELLDEPRRQQLLRSVADLRHELSAFHPRTPAALTHGQPAWRSVWIDEETFEIVGLTGFAAATIQPAEADLAHALFIEGVGAEDDTARAFYRGYGAARTMDVQRRERFYRRLAALQALLHEEASHPDHGIDRLIHLAGA